MRPHASAIPILVAISTVAFGQCSVPNGLTLAHQGNRLGDPFSVTLSGTPGVSGLLGVDVAAGVISTPIGNVCLGLTPSLQLLPFTLDSAGQFANTGMLPAQPGLIGLSAFLQAAAIDASQPSGSALSNSAGLTLRSPRVFFLDYGSALTTGPGSWCSYDALTDSVLVGPVPLPAVASDAILVPSFGWIAFLFPYGSTPMVQCYDATTGAPTISIPVPWISGRFALDGNTLYFTARLNGNPPGPPGFASMSFPSGVPGFFTTLAGSPSEYPPQAILIPPGSGHAYLRRLDRIAIVNLATGAELPSLYAGGGSPLNLEEWLLAGTTLYTLVYGQAFGYPAIVASIDTTTQQFLVPPVAVPFLAPVMTLRYGPGQFGNALFVQAINLNPPLIQLNPATLQPINQVAAIPAGINDMVLSPGGTEWLFRTCGGPVVLACGNPLLLSMQVPSMTVSTINPIGSPAQLLTSVPSATLRRAFWVYNTNLVVPFSTDPAIPPTGTVTLPIGSTQFRVLID